MFINIDFPIQKLFYCQHFIQLFNKFVENFEYNVLSDIVLHMNKVRR